MSHCEIEQLFRLDGKVIVITGGAGLMGRRHAEAVAAFGGIPVILDLSDSSAKTLADELSQRYDVPSLGYAVDITDEYQIEKNAAAVIERFGAIHGLVNNAANNPKMEEGGDKNFSRLENFPLEMWNNDVAVGLTGAFLCAKHYGNKISVNKAGGVIVNIASDLGLVAPDQRLYRKEGVANNQQAVKPVTYSVIKAGLIGLTRYLATYWVDQLIRCNALCPGGIENGQPEEFLNEVSSRIPMNRLARANEYQGSLVWMLSDASSYLNGAIVPVDGGRTTW